MVHLAPYASKSRVKLDTLSLVQMLIMANSSQHMPMTWHLTVANDYVACKSRQLVIRHGRDRARDEESSSLSSRHAECGEEGFVLSQLRFVIRHEHDVTRVKLCKTGDRHVEN